MAKPLQDVEVLRMGTGGEGVGHVPGSQMVVFVPYAAPGDKLRIQVVDEKARFERAQLVEVLKPGPGRIEAKCPVHFKLGRGPRWCGGCDWQQMDPQAQLEAKRAIVVENVERIGRLKTEVLPVIASPDNWRYRNKVQVPVQAGPGGTIKVGFYHPGSHEVVPFDDCLVQPELSVRIVKFVKELAERRKWQPYDEKTGRGWLRHIFVRTSSDQKALLAFVTRSEEFYERDEVCKELTQAFPELIGIHHNAQPLKTNVIFGKKWHKLWGKGRLREKLGHITIAASPAAFQQVNTPAAELLYTKAKEFLLEGGYKPELLWDLYSGIGSIALFLADSAPYVIGIEINRRAVEDAELNASINKIENARFLQGKAEYVVQDLKVERAGPWAVVLDPPRAGCEPQVLQFLEKPEFTRIVYISCDPSSFARDAALLCSKGWKLQRVQPVDLFPQTAHIELVALLTR